MVRRVFDHRSVRSCLEFCARYTSEDNFDECIEACEEGVVYEYE